MSGNQTSVEVQGQPDDSEPSLDRQAQLKKAYEANVEAEKPPYKGVEIRTRGELRWIMRQHGWTGEFDPGNQERRADFAEADFAGVNLSGIELTYANLGGAILDSANLSHALLFGANLLSAELAAADLTQTELQSADLSEADLADANLVSAKLLGAWLSNVSLIRANLVGADLKLANLSGANLTEARFDVTTVLAQTHFDSRTQLADVVWGDVPLTRIAWEEIPILGEETIAREKVIGRKRKDGSSRRVQYQTAARSYRQLAVALRDQGLSEDADRYAYRAQLMRRIVLRLEAAHSGNRRRIVRGHGGTKLLPMGLGYRLRKLAAYFGSGLLDIIAGYGYRPGRSLLAYILIILTFAGLYLLNGQFAAPHLRWDEALVLSVSSFHGRGFFTTDIHLGDTLARLAAGEAILGLLIEITFIATFTQRFFSR